jgi:hypothetical protein
LLGRELFRAPSYYVLKVWQTDRRNTSRAIFIKKTLWRWESIAHVSPQTYTAIYLAVALHHLMSRHIPTAPCVTMTYSHIHALPHTYYTASCLIPHHVSPWRTALYPTVDLHHVMSRHRPTAPCVTMRYSPICHHYTGHMSHHRLTQSQVLP